jgi:carbonic anhydrase
MHPPSLPDQALARLLEGNRRFVAGASAHAYAREARDREPAEGQRPFATIFGCADSRVPVELVFDQGFGDLFVIRNAGHIVGESVLGSMEFAVTSIGCPLIVVLGHSHCGAVTAAVKAWNERAYPPGHIASIVRAIEPVVKTMDTNDIDEVMRAHVVDSVRMIREMSEVLASELQRGAVWLAAAEYDLTSKGVNILQVVSQNRLTGC